MVVLPACSLHLEGAKYRAAPGLLDHAAGSVIAAMSKYCYSKTCKLTHCAGAMLISNFCNPHHFHIVKCLEVKRASSLDYVGQCVHVK